MAVSKSICKKPVTFHADAGVSVMVSHLHARTICGRHQVSATSGSHRGTPMRRARQFRLLPRSAPRMLRTSDSAPLAYHQTVSSSPKDIYARIQRD